MGVLMNELWLGESGAFVELLPCHTGRCEVGFIGQISSWSCQKYTPSAENEAVVLRADEGVFGQMGVGVA